VLNPPRTSSRLLSAVIPLVLMKEGASKDLLFQFPFL
jgi:hypothetical protein